MNGFDELQREVISTGLCVDCGTCFAACPRRSIRMDYELEEPILAGDCSPRCRLCSEVCPGKDIDLPGLARATLGRAPGPQESFLGVSRANIKGYAAIPRIRDAATGGGIVSALVVYALERGLIDVALVTGMSKDRPWRAAPHLATSADEVLANAKSKYQSVPTIEGLVEASAGGRRVGVVGLPCHLHGVRKIQALNRPKDLVRAVQFNIGIFCGSNSHHRGAEHTIEEVCGVPLAEVAKLEYRGGEYPGRFRVTTKDGRIIAPSPLALFSASSFYRDRCIMCYDYSAELADVAVGDYYHPDMKAGVRGWSVAAVRSETGARLVEGAVAAGYLYAEPVEQDYMLGTGFEVKRHGAVTRLLERKRHGWPVPDYHIPLEYPRPMRRKADASPPYLKT